MSPLSPSQAAVRRIGLAVRHGNVEAERIARQDALAAKISTYLDTACAGRVHLRPEQREALVAQLRAGGVA